MVGSRSVKQIFQGEPFMSKMNVPRILVGGLVSGLVMNLGEAALHAGVLGQDTEALYKRFQAPLPNPAMTIPLLIGMTVGPCLDLVVCGAASAARGQTENSPDRRYCCLDSGARLVGGLPWRRLRRHHHAAACMDSCDLGALRIHAGHACGSCLVSGNRLKVTANL